MYAHEEALSFRKERDEARRELGDVSKQFGIEQAEWEDQRKQLCDAITGLIILLRFLSRSFCLSDFFSLCPALSAENDRLKAAANRIADKVNAHGETVEERLDDADGRIDQVALHGVHLGVSLGLAAMSSRTGEDYSIQPVGFSGGPPEEIDDIDERLDQYEDHAAALAQSTNAQSVLNKLFEE